MIRVADYVINKLTDVNIKDIFMVTGRGVLYLSDAVAKNNQINPICVHHEQSASYAAMAYAQVHESGLGACLVSTGCASANAITGVLSAWQDSIPCIVISGQNILDETIRHTGKRIRTFGNQEYDVIESVSNITKYAVMIENPDDIAYELEKCIHIAKEGRPGPVWIDIPLNIQDSRVDEDKLRHYDEKDFFIHDDINYKEIVDRINNSKRPIFLIGSGIKESKSVEIFRKFAENFNIPVVVDNSAVDVFGSEHKLSLGVVSSIGGNRCANFAIQNSDLLISLGSRLSPVTTGAEYDKFAREAYKIWIDSDETELSKNTIEIDEFYLYDLNKCIGNLQKEEICINNDWIEKCKHWKQIFPKCESQFKNSELVDMYFLADKLSEYIEKNTIVITDAGMEELIFPSGISFNDSHRCIHPVAQGAMGAALPLAIGAYVATGNPVVAIIGDGSIMMNIQELQTISYNKMPIKIIVINNDCYAVIRKRQKDLFRKRIVGTDESNGVNCPKFENVANCFGLNYQLIENTKDMDIKLPLLINNDESMLSEVLGLLDQKYLHDSYTFNKKRKYVKRSLEDQSPFLDRDVFLSEMIIEPIDQ